MANPSPGPYPVPRSERLGRIVESLRLAAFYALATHFEDGLRHCGEASIAAVAVLHRRGLRARVLPCAIVGAHTTHPYAFSVGLSAREVYQLQADRDSAVPPFEEWSAQQGSTVPDGEWAFHAVVETWLDGERAVIDLTLGQLLHDFGVPVPASIGAYGPGWLALEAVPWRLRYLPCPRRRQVSAFLEGKPQRGLANDLEALMGFADAAHLDTAAMYAMLVGVQPEMVALTVERWAAWAAGPTRSGFGSTG